VCSLDQTQFDELNAKVKNGLSMTNDELQQYHFFKLHQKIEYD
jgi:hypothetical protein